MTSFGIFFLNMLPESRPGGHQVEIQPIPERLDHRPVTGEGCQHPKLLCLVIDGPDQLTRVSDEAPPDNPVPRGQGLCRDTCNRHPGSPGLQRVDRSVTTIPGVPGVQELLDPRLTPLTRFLSFADSDRQLGRPLLGVVCYQGVQQLLIDLEIAGRCPAFDLHTCVGEGGCHLLRGVDVLQPEGQRSSGPPFPIFFQFVRKLLGILDIEQEPGPLHIGTHLCQPMLERDKAPSRAGDSRQSFPHQPASQYRVHPRVQLEVRVAHQLRYFPDECVLRFVLAGKVGHQCFDTVCYVGVDVRPGQFFERMTCPAFFFPARVDQVRQDLGIGDFRPHQAHRDT